MHAYAHVAMYPFLQAWEKAAKYLLRTKPQVHIHKELCIAFEHWCKKKYVET